MTFVNQDNRSEDDKYINKLLPVSAMDYAPIICHLLKKSNKKLVLKIIYRLTLYLFSIVVNCNVGKIYHIQLFDYDLEMTYLI